MSKGPRFNDVITESNDFWDETAQREQAEAEASAAEFEDEPGDGYDEMGADDYDSDPEAATGFENLIENESAIEIEAEAEAQQEDGPPRIPITEEVLDAGFFAEPSPAVIEEIAAEQPEPGIAEPESGEGSGSQNMEAILAQVDDAMALAVRPAELTPEQLENGEKIAASTAILEWFFHAEGFTRKVDPGQIVSSEYQQAAAASMLRASKKGIVCDQLEAINQRKRKFKSDISVLRLHTEFLRGGQALIPLAHVDQIESLWEEFAVDFYRLVRAFLVVYVSEQARAQQLQGALFNLRHYPSLDKVAAAFTVDHRWLVFDAPAATEEIKAAAFREADKHLRAQVAEAGVEIAQNLREQAAGYIQWFIGQLEVGEDGRRKSIDEKKFAAMQRFFDGLGQTLNVTGDMDFNNAVEMGKAIIAGRDVADFKANGKQRATADQLREETARAFEGIKAQTAGWVVNQPVRPVYSLEDV